MLCVISNRYFRPTADIELSDESGNVKNLRDPGLQHKYANELLEEREKLVLLKVESRFGKYGSIISHSV